MNHKDFNKEFSALPEELKKQVEGIILSYKSSKKIKPSTVKKTKNSKKRILGLANGEIKILPGFDDPIKAFKEYI